MPGMLGQSCLYSPTGVEVGGASGRGVCDSTQGFNCTLPFADQHCAPCRLLALPLFYFCSNTHSVHFTVWTMSIFFRALQAHKANSPLKGKNSLSFICTTLI